MAMRSTRYVGHVFAGAAVGACLIWACSSASSGGTAGGIGATSASGGSGNTANAGGTGNVANPGGGINLDGSLTDATLNPDAACDLQKYEATLVKKPVDIVFI